VLGEAGEVWQRQTEGPKPVRHYRAPDCIFNLFVKFMSNSVPFSSMCQMLELSFSWNGLPASLSSFGMFTRSWFHFHPEMHRMMRPSRQPASRNLALMLVNQVGDAADRKSCSTATHAVHLAFFTSWSAAPRAVTMRFIHGLQI
jgi:hypothetical protein